MISPLTILSTYVTSNAVGIALRVFPTLLLASLVLTEWYTSSVFQRAGLLVVIVATVITTMEIAGKLPVIALPDSPSMRIKSTHVEN
jgi:hypothetical protein